MAAKRKAGALLQHVLPKESLNPEPADITDDEQFSGRNGEAGDGMGGVGGAGGDTNMAELWASYHSALGLAGSRRNTRDQSSPVLLSGGTTEPGGAHDETSSSAGNGKEDDDAMGSDDESDDRLDPQQHDPERLKAFNMFVRLFVDENLDRIVPISKQPKEKIQAIIDSCTRQFPEFAERARKRIRTYLKSCRRNKKVRGDTPTTPAWDSAIRPTPAHLTSVQAEQILAQACENESHNAKRMRLGLEPVSQAMPTSTPGATIDTTAASIVTHPLLGLYTSTSTVPNSVQSKPGESSSMENGGLCLNNNNIAKPISSDTGSGSKNASPASSPAPLPLFRSNFPQTFGTHQSFGRQSSRTSTPSATVSATDFTTSLGMTAAAAGAFGSAGGATPAAILSSLGSGAGATSAAVAAYQSALFSAAMAAGAHHPGQINFGGLGVGLVGNDLSMKNSTTSTSITQTPFPASLSTATAATALGLAPSVQTTHAQQTSSKPLLLSHKLNTAEMAAVRQLITGYRESAAFLLRSADELETLLLQQP